jgi:hypothetical protein
MTEYFGKECVSLFITLQEYHGGVVGEEFFAGCFKSEIQS